MQPNVASMRVPSDFDRTPSSPCRLNSRLLLLLLLALTGLAAVPNPTPETPGQTFEPPNRPVADGSPLIFENSREAGPDETFFLVGQRLTTNVFAWGVSANAFAGQAWRPRVQFLTNGYLAATLPEAAHDGPFLVWVKNQAGWSVPFVLNQPEPWWCGPDIAPAGAEVRVFGRNLSRRPDSARAFVYLCQKGKTGIWPDIVKPGKYAVTFRLPTDLSPGNYQVWVHAGAGGKFGWGGPVPLRVIPAARSSWPSSSASTESARVKELKAGATAQEIRNAMEDLSTRAGGMVRLAPGTFQFSGTLRIPAKVMLVGAGREETTLQLFRDPTASFARLHNSGWNQAPGGIQTPGDRMEYEIDVPKAGRWTVWLRYATDMAPWGQSGVSGNHALSVDGGAPVPLMNLPNTGGWGAFRWSKSATLKLSAGRHTLTWRNLKGGGISLDAFVFALDPQYVPSDHPFPASGSGVLVLQAEDCTRFISKAGRLPGGDHAAVWLAGDGAGLRDLSLFGDAQVNIGVAIAAPQPLRWITNCVVERVRVADCGGKQGENCGIYLRYVDHAQVLSNDLFGRAPLFLSGARQSQFIGNRLVSVTRFGGNAEAAILGRTEPIEECIIESNVVASPSDAQAGGPTARRLLWFSTGHGSVVHNWIADNGVEKPNGPGAAVGAGQARFGGVAGTDQNVGEMILFEGNYRTAYFGPLASAGNQSVILPKTIPPTPDSRLGSVRRRDLAHDSAGHETPFWPPDFDDGSAEPPIYEYFVSVFKGRGQGQTRRVLKREGQTLVLDYPWNVAPGPGSVVAVGTGFYQNLIVGNYTADGMTGIQLWISCVENVVANNTIARQRKPGIFLYANGTTLASSMPRTWNRGISPLFWNVCEGNRVEDCSVGALVTSGDANNLPVEFPRALGNVLRHNSFIRSRAQGVLLTSRPASVGVTDTAASITGTIVEFNVVRDAQVAYCAGHSCDAVVFRRNQAYFWYPVNSSTEVPTAFELDAQGMTAAIRNNSIEGINGVYDNDIRDLKTPAGFRRLPQ